MKLYDVSTSIFEGMPVFNNSPEKQPKITTVTNAHVTESRIDMNLHSGTHVDAPLHMINDDDTMETIHIEDLVGHVKVFDLSHVEDQITKSDIEPLDIAKNDFVIFKTKNSLQEAFDFDFIFVNEDAAAHLIDIKIRGVGIDNLGIERSQPGHPTHRSLFKNRIIIMEGLRLKEVPEGKYFMVGAPLKMVGTEAAPARVLLMDGISVL